MGKLAASLPGERGRRAGRIRERLLVDSAGWGRRGSVSPHLRVVQDAVFGDRRLHLEYRRAEAQVVERDVDPLGLIIKAGVWYLLADLAGERRLFRLSRIESARALDETARRPKRFDLAKAWREQSQRWESGRTGFEVVLRVARSEDLPLVIRVSGERLIGKPRNGVVRLAFPALEPAAAFVSSFGAMVEVIRPREVREELARRGQDLTKLYGRDAMAGAGRSRGRARPAAAARHRTRAR
jgi:predicted DNA-binding transcriptional regulator YafY